MGSSRLFRIAAAAAGLLVLLLGGEASSSGPAPVSTWVVSPSQSGVSAVAVSGSTAYIGGSFGYVGPQTGGFASLDPTTGGVASTPPMVDGDVYAAAADGSGGFFIGGQFRLPGSDVFRQLAHIRSDGTVDPDWQPRPETGVAFAIAVSDTAVYVGGVFGSGLMAFDRTSGADLETFDADVTGGDGVKTLELSGSTLYVGGDFDGLDGIPRTNLGAVDAVSGEVTPWSPTTDGIVLDLAVSADTVYVGGHFAKANGATPRSNAAAFDRGTGAVRAGTLSPTARSTPSRSPVRPCIWRRVRRDGRHTARQPRGRRGLERHRNHMEP